jgi:hypothetical protein
MGGGIPKGTELLIGIYIRKASVIAEIRCDEQLEFLDEGVDLRCKMTAASRAAAATSNRKGFLSRRLSTAIFLSAPRVGRPMATAATWEMGIRPRRWCVAPAGAASLRQTAFVFSGALVSSARRNRQAVTQPPLQIFSN